MKVYIAGKITGDPDYKTKFEEAQKLLEQSGHVVISPAVLPEGMSPSDYMRICFAMIDVADAVFFLPDLEESRGARLEFAYYEYTGKQRLIPERSDCLCPNHGKIPRETQI